MCDIVGYVGLRFATRILLNNDSCMQEFIDWRGTRRTILTLCGRMRVVKDLPLSDPQRWSYAVHGLLFKHNRPEAPLSRLA